MTAIIVDQATQAKLDKADRAVELRDEAGRLLGYFSPAVDRSVYDEIEIPISEEELDRRSKAGGGRTLSEIMADLNRQQ
jgi:hypothetical protein